MIEIQKVTSDLRRERDHLVALGDDKRSSRQEFALKRLTNQIKGAEREMMTNPKRVNPYQISVGVSVKHKGGNTDIRYNVGLSTTEEVANVTKPYVEEILLDFIANNEKAKTKLDDISF